MIEQHEHGPHACYCPECSYQETVEEGVRCNTLTCPQCGSQMRAVETGEFRSQRVAQEEEPLPLVPAIIVIGIVGFGIFLAAKQVRA